MTLLDKRCIRAAKPLRGLSTNAERIVAALQVDLGRDKPITLRIRHALYAICWRFRRQLAIDLQVKIALALADAKMAVELLAVEAPPEIRSQIGGFDGGATVRRNPLDDLFGGVVA